MVNEWWVDFYMQRSFTFWVYQERIETNMLVFQILALVFKHKKPSLVKKKGESSPETSWELNT